jgi:Tol biopolymer transport system component
VRGDRALVRALWYSDPDGSGVRRIPLGLRGVRIEGYDWSADGRRIVFAAVDAAGRVPVLYTISATGENRKVIGRGWRPRWSPDGRHVAFMSRLYRGPERRDDADEISVVKPDGTGARRLTRSRHDSWPSFSPDGKKVVFVRTIVGRSETDTRAYQWRVVDVTGRHDVRVLSRREIGRVSYSPPEWTPDGKRLAAVRTVVSQTPPPLPVSVFTVTLVTVSRTGGAERSEFALPFRSVNSFSWRPER